MPEDHSHPSELPEKSQSKGTKDDATRDQASTNEDNANEEAGSSVGIWTNPTDGHGGGQGEQPNAATVAEAPSQVDVCTGNDLVDGSGENKSLHPSPSDEAGNEEWSRRLRPRPASSARG